MPLENDESLAARQAGEAIFRLGVAFGDRIVAQVRRVSAADEERAAYQATLIFFFCKAFKTYKAVQVLCREGFAEDAFVLVRTMFEAALQAMYLAEDPKGRTRKFVKFDPVYRYGYYLKLKQSGATDLAGEIEQRPSDLEALRKDYECLKGNYPEKCTHWWGNNIFWLAEHLKVQQEYRMIYWLQSNIAHTAITSVNEYMSMKNGALHMRIAPSQCDFRIPSDASVNFLRVCRCLVKELAPDLVAEEEAAHSQMVDVVKSFRPQHPNPEPSR